MDDAEVRGRIPFPLPAASQCADSVHLFLPRAARGHAMTSLPKIGAASPPGSSAAPAAAPAVPGAPVPPTFPTPGSGGTGPTLAPGMAKLAAAMSESDLERKVRAICRDLGVLVYHTFDSRRSEPGFPDLVLVGRRVAYRELKKENGRLTQAQKTWIAALERAGQDAAVWRPAALLSGDVAREVAWLAGVGAR